jgi:hypothetical protein
MAQDRRAAPRGQRRTAPGTRPHRRPPRLRTPHAKPPANNNRMQEGRISCRQQPAPPPRDAAKMSPRISTSPEPVLAAHVPSPTAAGSHCPARDGSAPHLGNRVLAVIHGLVTVSTPGLVRNSYSTEQLQVQDY